MKITVPNVLERGRPWPMNGRGPTKLGGTSHEVAKVEKRGTVIFNYNYLSL